MKSSNSNKHVHKFGGSSLADAARFQAVSDILSQGQEIIVVSAVKGTTQNLQNALDKAQTQENTEAIVQQLLDRHQAIINTLLDAEQSQTLINRLEQDCADMLDILHSVKLVQSYSKEIQDSVLSYGELWSAQIMAAFLNQQGPCHFIDAAKIIHTYLFQDTLAIDWDKSSTALQAFLNEHSTGRIVIPGFTASDDQGKRITLGLNGSDFSAAIIAKCTQAEKLTIWTDVDGVYSADPRKVPSAFVLDELSYKEALELAFFGAAVIHPKAIAPAIDHQIPILIRNSFNPQAPGTLIHAEHAQPSRAIQGISSIDEVALINIEGAGMIGVSGFAAKVFSMLQAQGISLILISQGSSEHSICFAIPKAQKPKAMKALREYLAFEIKQHIVEDIVSDDQCSILAIVGEGMIGTRGIVAELSKSLANANINIRAVAQGSSERNVSIVLAAKDISRALRAVHGGFYLSNKTISIGLIGPGLVGQALLAQISANRQQLAEHYGINLQVRGISNSQKMLLDHQHLTPSDIKETLAQQGQPIDIQTFVKHVVAEDIPHAVIIDCTANQSIADQYIDFIDRGAHIITPNKRASSGDFDFYEALLTHAQAQNRHFLYETTVCAGLPVIKTLQDLIQTGDEIFSIEGIVSGTLGYIFDKLSQGDSFSNIVKQAKDLGYTEPDPRDDLSGMDVARKMVCLARELGFETTLDDVQVHNLIPQALRDCDLNTFLEKLADFDQDMQTLSDAANSNHEKLAYVGAVHADGRVEVAIQAYAADHPFSRLQGADNMLCFRTKRYDAQPLIIQGPGAGADVTAAGVFADLLRLVSLIS